MKHDHQMIPTLIQSAKWAFTTRRVNRADVVGLQKDYKSAVSGDLVLCQITKIGQHKKLQLATGRYSESYVGDLIVVCLGDRYAPDQFEGEARLSDGFGQLFAAGGMVGTVQHAHDRMAKATEVLPLGLLKDHSGEVMNIASYALPAASISEHVTVFGVFGASMNAGKTTAAVSLAHGLAKSGYAVAGVKATGTGAFADFNAFEDAGIKVTDFTDAGLASTYRVSLDVIEQCFETLVGHAAQNGADIVVVEIADGVFQQETAAILENSKIRDRMDGVLFAAPDALGSVGGVDIMTRYGLPPFAVSGMVTCSPLATREATKVTGVPHLTKGGLCNPAIISPLAKPMIRHLKPQREIAA